MGGFRREGRIYPESPVRAGVLCWVAETLQRRDKDFRIRWSWEKKAWALEAKAFQKAGLYKPVVYVPVKDGSDVCIETMVPELSDRRIGWNDGYYQIGFVSQEDLDGRVIAEIGIRDAGRFKNGKEALRKIQEAEDKEEAARDKRSSDIWRDRAGEVHDYMMVKTGQKTYMRPGSSVHTDSTNWW